MKILAIALLIPSTAATVFGVASNAANPVASTALLLAIIVACTAIWQLTTSPLISPHTSAASCVGVPRNGWRCGGRRSLFRLP